MESFRMESLADEQLVRMEASSSGISWAAVIGGAFVAAALSVILLALGTGLGLSSVSPWSNVGASASMIGGASIAWLIAMQIISSAMGGFTAGRLRTKWTTLHSDEVHFRDTAHGLLVWCVGLVITVYFLASGASAMVGGAMQAGSGAGTLQTDGRAYFVDTLFRSTQPISDGRAAANSEAGRILANALLESEMPPADRSYLAQLVSTRTGLSQADSEKRVNEVITSARQSADKARKAAAHTLLWIFIALLIGAFSASYAATIGGRQRDQAKLV